MGAKLLTGSQRDICTIIKANSMNPKVQTSFIPKSPVASVSFSHSTSGRINIFLVVAVIIFIVSIVAALGVFIYQRSLVSSISDMSTRLAKARDEFELGFT